MNNKPIGIMDSGVGGLLLLKRLTQSLPFEDFVYLGDTARFPYGDRNKQTIAECGTSLYQTLLEQDVKMIVCACVTTSSCFAPPVANKERMPYCGSVIPASQQAVAMSINGSIGVIGTAATLSSNAFAKAVRNIRSDARVLGNPCPLLVELSTSHQSGVRKHILEAYLSPFGGGKVDSLIIGCTHYPLLYDNIAHILGYQVNLIDPVEQEALFVETYLPAHSLLADPRTPTIRCLCTGEPEQFLKDATQIWGGAFPYQPEKISLQSPYSN